MRHRHGSTLQRAIGKRVGVIAAATVVCLGSHAAAQETFFAIEHAGGFPDLVQLDPQSGIAITSSVFGHVAGLNGLTEHGGRLLSIDQVPNPVFPNHLVALQVASTRMQPVGQLAFKVQFIASVERDPTTSRVYALIDGVLHEIDPNSGSTTVIAPVTPLTDAYSTLAIDRNGRAVTTGVQNPRIYSLDLATGVATKLGALSLGAGQFYDLAFASDGTLWGTYDDFAASNSKTGLYTIDLTTVTATMRVKLSKEYAGLAFMPAPELERYCTAKVNSLGCTPKLHSFGIPSATADRGFDVWVSDVGNRTLGCLAWSVSGPTTLPFGGGTLCVRPPLGRSPFAASGGSASAPMSDCTGSLSIDFNAYAWYVDPDPALHVPGASVWCQWFARDPGFSAPNDVSLSAALRFELLP